MKAIACGSVAVLLVLAGCGGQKKAEEPENTLEPATSTAPAESAAASDSPPAPASSVVVGGDDPSKKPSPCSGAHIPDLLSVVSQAACEAPDAKADAQKDVKDLLDIKVATDSPVVSPGATVQVTLTYKNKSKAELPLYFVVDPEPRFAFEVYGLKGGRVDNPPGGAPPLPPEVLHATPAEPKIARVTLAAQGTATLSLKWDVVRYKWASKERAKGALPGRGYPREPSGPLRKGKYVLRVVTPLTGVAEGTDHELSQPRTQVTVGGR
jgi:hypothetical protein